MFPSIIFVKPINILVYLKSVVTIIVKTPNHFRLQFAKISIFSDYFLLSIDYHGYRSVHPANFIKIDRYKL